MYLRLHLGHLLIEFLQRSVEELLVDVIDGLEEATGRMSPQHLRLAFYHSTPADLADLPLLDVDGDEGIRHVLHHGLVGEVGDAVSLGIDLLN